MFLLFSLSCLWSFEFYSCVFLFRQFETVIPVEDSVITEMTSTLRDWGAMWKQLYVVWLHTQPQCHIHTACIDLNINTLQEKPPFCFLIKLFGSE